MNAFNQQIKFKQDYSWSEYMNEILSMCNSTEKHVVHKSAGTLFKFFCSHYQPSEALMFIRGSRL